MECIFPQDCNCFDCRFERLEAIFEATSTWHTGERTNIEMYVPVVLDDVEDEDAGRCLPYYEDHDPIQDLPIDQDEDILPF